MKRTILALMLVGMILPKALWASVVPINEIDNETPRIEVVFALDTTGSMGGLIHAAKEKIWAIANTLATAKPAPQIRMGLVGYRDRGDEYVTTLTALTDDLDAVYAQLMTFSAGGGGDGPESVNEAVHKAVTETKWSKNDNTYRVIFLVGDSPPHMDYADDIKYAKSCKIAAEAGIVINTIQCGSQHETELIWSDIARRAEGRYFRVEQSGSAILAETPVDKDIADLSRKLDETRIHYGTKTELAAQARRKRTADTIYSRGSVSAKAQRAAFNASAAGKRNFLGDKELVSDLDSRRVQLAELDEEQLPESMRMMSVQEREAFVARQSKERKELQMRINELSAQRQEYMKAQAAKRKNEPTLDQGIFDCIKEQAAKHGITYTGGPTL